MSREMLKKYAEVLVKVGVNVKEGDLIQLNGDTESLPLLREIARSCWKAGARDVITEIADDRIRLSKFEEAGEAYLDYFPGFRADYLEEMLKAKYHRIHLSAPSLDLFAHIDQKKIQTAQKAALSATEHLEKHMHPGDIKWTAAACPSLRWARELFPGLDEESALNKLWEVVLRICRVDREDPVAAWQEHDKNLKARESWLDSQDFSYLHYQGPGTDLTCRLADRHKWIGGSSTTPDGVDYMANIPTEELFTTPHAMKVDGRIRSTMPLSVMGKIVEDFGFTFKEGQVVDYHAGKNAEVLETLLGMDEGARRLGEVAIVPDSSPVSRSGLLFKTTLFDENASCHFALGQAYAEAIRGGSGMTEEERGALGSNKSMIHIDFMVGGPELSITGYKKDGTALPVLRDGEWAF
ncbi:MAG TPA: aminopeptidase [Bacillota bacterium]|jgi:aminopeptidase|nr:aminopeptidase [Fastidiosipila sp.]HPX93721.1 aminopeptidase [Bacillota bacterium]HQB81469.1 aminopeptidase [Bacillota bacterium]